MPKSTPRGCQERIDKAEPEEEILRICDECDCDFAPKEGDDWICDECLKEIDDE